jgi:sugar lactone lactonase YvrE
VSKLEVELVLDAQAELGEGPLWDAERGRLMFVDILRGHVHDFDPASGRDRVVEVGRPVGAMALTTKGDWLAAVPGAVLRCDPQTGATAPLASFEADLPGNRANDGYCDARGRFWIGTMALDEHRHAGALHRVDPGGAVRTMLPDVTISNGIDWSPDGRRMYYADSGEPRIDVFDFDEEKGEIANRRPLVELEVGAGSPDGLIVDAEGCVWLCLWGGGAVRRYTPDGRLDRVVAIPVPHPTKCAFGGPDLGDLYVTTAWIGLKHERSKHPQAGGLFRCRPGVKGRLPNRFAG